MVAKEVHTSDSIKQLPIQTPGVDNDKWEQTYKGDMGGVLTTQSKLSEPIHKIATCTIKLWKAFDKTVFKLAKDKRQGRLNTNADSVIEKLNRDHAKPWFAQGEDGAIVKDLGDLMYEETAPISFISCASSTSPAGSIFLSIIFLAIGSATWMSALPVQYFGLPTRSTILNLLLLHSLQGTVGHTISSRCFKVWFKVCMSIPEGVTHADA